MCTLTFTTTCTYIPLCPEANPQKNTAVYVVVERHSTMVTDEAVQRSGNEAMHAHYTDM